MKSRVSGAHFTVGAGLVLAFAAIISSVDCQGPDQGSTPIPHLTLNGSILLNNTRIQLSEVGIDSTAALRCVTDLSTCCNNGSHSGRWVAVDQSGDFYQQRLVAGGVELHHVEAFAVGNYRCEIDTAASIARGGPRDVLYVSIFEGDLDETAVSLRLRNLQALQPPLFSLICRTSFSSATTVTWFRGTEMIDGGVTTSVTRSDYFNVLNVTEEGVYSCEVLTISSTNDELVETQTLNVTTPLQPVNLTVTQTGPRGVLVTWTPTGRPSQYTVYYQEQGSFMRAVTAGPDSTFIFLPIDVIFVGSTYSVEILAETALSSNIVGPVDITIGNLVVNVQDSVPVSGAYLGQTVMVTCEVTLAGSAAGVPTIKWQAPLPVPTPTLSSPGEGVFVSEFVIDSFHPSHEGTYVCEASVDNLSFSVENSAIINFNQNSQLSVVPSAEVLNMHPLQFAVICTSSGGIPANVTWMRDSTVIEGGVTVLNDDFRSYRHILNATEEGIYTCIVSNDTPDNATASINVTIPNPPSNLTVTQNGMDSVLVSWTPSDGAEFYTILYQQPDQMPDMVFVPDGRADSITIGISPTFSILGLPFSFTLIAHTALPSVAVGPVEFTLGVLDARILPSFEGRPIVGGDFSLVCDVTVYGNLSGTPEFSWIGPGGDLPEPIRTSNTQSTLKFFSLRLSQTGEYSCTVQLEGFPYTATESFNLDIDFLVTRPRVSVRASRDSPYYSGTGLNLTCDIELDPLIDIPVVESIQWVIGGVIFNPVAMDRVTITEDAVEFFPVDVVDNAVFRCDVLFSTESIPQPSEEFELTVEDLPPLEVELIAPPNTTAGGVLTIECLVMEIPHLITPPQVELVGPGATVLVNDTGYSVSETFNPLTALQAGEQYFCRAKLEIESVDISLRSESDIYTVTVYTSPTPTVPSSPTPSLPTLPPPTLVLSSSPQGEVEMGSSIVLICVATLPSQLRSVKLVWEGPQTVISSSDNSKYEIVEVKSDLTYSSNLTVSDVNKEDEGEYKCTATGVDTNDLMVTSDRSISISVIERRSSATVIQWSGLTVMITGITAILFLPHF